MENDIFEMLEDFGTCLGGNKFKPHSDNTIKGKLENGADLFLQLVNSDNFGSSVWVYIEKIGLPDCSFYARSNVSNEVSRLIGNYFSNRREALTQSDLDVIGNINLKELQDAIDIWLK